MDVKELDNLDDYCLLNGHNKIKRFDTNQQNTDAIVDISNVIELLPKEVDVPRRFRHSMRNSAKKFMNEKFVMHDVRYISNSKLETLCMDDSVEVDELIDNYNKLATLIDPFKLPIKYILDDVMGGQLISHFVVSQDEEKLHKIISGIKISFCGIELPKTITELATTSYVHEITHALLESNKYSVLDYYNSELLSIFLEFVYAYENNKELFKLLIVKRISQISLCYNYMYLYNQGDESLKVADKSYNEYQYNVDAKYVISTIKVFNLLDLYINGSDIMKNNIISRIQLVFDGNRTLEEFLKDTGVTLDSSMTSSHVKRLIK